MNGSTEKEPVRSGRELPDADGNSRQADLAWAAGFFDGEGHIAIHRTRDTSSFNLMLNLAQVDPRPIKAFQELLGGTTYRRGARGNRRPNSVWWEWGHRAGEVLKQLRPYLRHKAEQADVAIEFQEGKKRHRGVVASPEEFAKGEWAATTLKEIRASFGSELTADKKES